MSPDELRELAERTRVQQADTKTPIRVCTAAGCHSSGGGEVKSALQEATANRPGCAVIGVGCMGLCARGPLVQVGDDGPMYGGVTADDTPAIVASIGGRPVEALAVDTTQPFFTEQRRLVLENCGRIDPEEITAYIARGGYASLAQVLTEHHPGEIIEELVQSGLRGRGGAGYPTGLKWTTVAKAAGQPKYIVCNADEGDPGAFMDRSVLEGDPHRVIEGMVIAGYAVGANHGYIYVRVEYPLAVERLQRAIKQARRLGFLGQNLAGTQFSFQLDLRLGAGAFVCGEETALMASIQGGRGTPVSRPPYPAESGLWGCPTLINNVETFANVPVILREGGAWFAGIGTERSTGTKVFALAGKIRNTGLIEVPMGTPLRTLIEDIGGGVPEDRALKAIQTGGPSGGCIPACALDTPVDYESLGELGSIMGSGGLIVMDDTASMVEVARYFMEFSMSESCGKCVPCRVGTVQLHRMLEDLLQGRAGPDALAGLESLCDVVRTCSACGLGQSAPNPVSSTLRYFREEYEALTEGR